MEDIVLIGSGGHAKSVADAIERGKQFRIVGFVSPGNTGDTVYKNYKIIGQDQDLKEIFLSGVRNVFVSIGFMGKGTLRNEIYNKLKQIGFRLPYIIDPTAILASDVYIGEGVFVGKRAVINAGTQIQDMAIINTGAIVEHDCIIGAYSHVAVSAIVCGNVQVEDECFIGANATIIQGHRISKGAVIGAGAIIVRDVECDMKVYNKTLKVSQKK